MAYAGRRRSKMFQKEGFGELVRLSWSRRRLIFANVFLCPFFVFPSSMKKDSSNVHLLNDVRMAAAVHSSSSFFTSQQEGTRGGKPPPPTPSPPSNLSRNANIPFPPSLPNSSCCHHRSSPQGVLPKPAHAPSPPIKILPQIYPPRPAAAAITSQRPPPPPSIPHINLLLIRSHFLGRRRGGKRRRKKRCLHKKRNVTERRTESRSAYREKWTTVSPHAHKNR